MTPNLINSLIRKKNGEPEKGSPFCYDYQKLRFLSDETNPLLASNIFKKGVALPEAQVVINADEGLEEANVIQKKGRVLGTTATKTRSLVVDFFDLYDAYFSEHSEARLNTYVDAVGEDKVGIVDVSVDGGFASGNYEESLSININLSENTGKVDTESM